MDEEFDDDHDQFWNESEEVDEGFDQLPHADDEKILHGDSDNEHDEFLYADNDDEHDEFLHGDNDDGKYENDEYERMVMMSMMIMTMSSLNGRISERCFYLIQK